MCASRYSPGHGLCAVHMYVSSIYKMEGITAVSCLCPLSQPEKERIEHKYFYGFCISQERIQLWLLCQMEERLYAVMLCYVTSTAMAAL